MSNMDIVRATSTVLADHVLKPVGKKRSWKWVYQTVVFPEVKCPYCKTGVTSTAVWFIEKENRLVGQAIPVADAKFVLERPDHPHACDDGKGQICFGTAQAAIQALFGSLNHHARYKTKEGGYGGLPAWLAGKYFNHRCETIDKWLARPAPELFEDGDEDEDEGYHCDACGDGVTDGDTYDYGDNTYCQDCFHERAFYCFNCGDAHDKDDVRKCPEDNKWCEGCFDKYWFECECCTKIISKDDRRDGGPHADVCAECFAKPEFVSCPCGEWYTTDLKYTTELHKDHGVTATQAAEDLCVTCGNTRRWHREENPCTTGFIKQGEA